MGLNCIGILLGIVSGTLIPLNTIAIGDVVNSLTIYSVVPSDASANNVLTTINNKIVFWVVLFAIQTATIYISIAAFVYTSERQVSVIRRKYLKAVLRQDVSFFDEVGPGEVASRISSDTLLVQDGIGEKISFAVTQVSTFVSAFAIAFSKSWRLSVVLLAAIPPIVFCVGFITTVGGKFQKIIVEKYASAGSAAEETLSSIRTIVAFNAQQQMADRYSHRLLDAKNAGVKKAFSFAFGLALVNLFIFSSYALAFYYGYILLTEDLIDAGTVVNVFFAILLGSFALGQLAPDLQAFSLAQSAAAKLFATIDRVPDIDPYDESGSTIPDFEGRIKLNKVEFTYPTRKEVKILQGIDLEIEPGQTVALVGQSGSGKSTIIQLLERFYDPEVGSIQLDGHDLKELSVKWLRSHISLVSQEPTLFEGSIADNVAFGLIGSPWENVSFEKKQELVEDACTQANAHDFICKLPQGYDTQVGEGGLLLSGGQKQRVAIARAIIKNPKILLLDEATSALDTTSERVVQEALDKVSISRTTITIAHRLSTIRNADKIVVMVRGEIVEQGNHDELVLNNGLYAQLVLAQNISKADSQETLDAKSQAETEELLTSNPDSYLRSLSRIKLAEKQLSIKSAKSDMESAATEKRMSMCTVFIRIMRFNIPELKFIIPALVAAIGSGMAYPVLSIIYSQMLQTFAEVGDKQKHDAEKWSLFFVYLAIFLSFFNLVQFGGLGVASELLTERLRGKTFLAILRQDIWFFDQDENSVGSLTSNLSSDPQAIQGVSGSVLGSILQVTVNILGGVVVSLLYGWKLALVAMCCLPLIIGAGYLRFKVLSYFAEQTKAAYEKSSSLACEAVSAIKTVQSLTRETHLFELYSKMLDAPLQKSIESAWRNTIFYALSQSIVFLVYALVYWYGAQLIVYEGYEMQQMFVIFMAIIIGATSAGRVFAYTPDMSKAKSSGEAIVKLIDHKPDIDAFATDGKPVNKDTVTGRIEFKDVRFAYPTRQHIRVLRGLNLVIKPGQFVAFVGSSGCGKSTTIGLLERFYSITQGRILLDGQDIADINVAEYRNVVGIVSQEPNLFDMSIKENLLLGWKGTKPSQTEIESACQEANIHDFIMSLPQGYDTVVGRKGGQLSGGQKQRIAIARALLRKPKILLLDEATSALDANSEKVVQQALDVAAKGRTTIAIAHRLSSIQHADVIFVFKDGVVAEKGTHSELYDKKGLYYDLVIQQDLESTH